MEKSYKINTEEVFSRKVEDETVVLNHKTNSYLVLNQTAGTIWESLEKNEDVAQIAEKLALKYKVDIDTAHNDIKELLENLVKEHLIECIER